MSKYPGKVLAVLAALVAFPPSALAECDTGACKDIKITFLYVDSTAASWLSTSGNEALLTECAPGGSPLLKIDPLRTNADWLYTMALTAFTTNQTVSVRIDTSVPSTCTVAYITMGKL